MTLLFKSKLYIACMYMHLKNGWISAVRNENRPRADAGTGALILRMISFGLYLSMSGCSDYFQFFPDLWSTLQETSPVLATSSSAWPGYLSPLKSTFNVISNIYTSTKTWAGISRNISYWQDTFRFHVLKRTNWSSEFQTCFHHCYQIHS